MILFLKEINKLLTTKSERFNDNELTKFMLQIKYTIITNNRKYLTTQSINDKMKL